MAEYITGMGERIVNVHEPEQCAGTRCPIHNPSNHSLKDAPTNWHQDGFGVKFMERVCSHGIAHPDPDGWDFYVKHFGVDVTRMMFTHVCDGCCDNSLELAKHSPK